MPLSDLIAALVATLSARELAALEGAAKAAPGPLSALAAAITSFAARALASRRLAFALIAEPVEPEIDAARTPYRQALVNEFGKLIRNAQAGGRHHVVRAGLCVGRRIGWRRGGFSGRVAASLQHLNVVLECREPLVVP